MKFPVPQPSRRRLLGAAAALPLSGWLGGCSASDAAPADPQKVRVRDHRIRVDSGVWLHVREWRCGQAEGPAIVLLHDAGGNAQCFNGLARALAERARVIAITQRGFGQSDKPAPERAAYGTDRLADDVQGVLDTLTAGPVVLGGHGLAGTVITRFAARYPRRVRGLLYLDAPFDPSAGPAPASAVPPVHPALVRPLPEDADGASLADAVAYRQRISRHWSAPLEAQFTDALARQPDGRMQPGTPPEVLAAALDAAQAAAPDYRAVRARALVVGALPAEPRDLFPWLPLTADAASLKAARALVDGTREARLQDTDRLLAALPPDSQRLVLDGCTHEDFFIEREAELVRTVRWMNWR